MKSVIDDGLANAWNIKNQVWQQAQNKCYWKKKITNFYI